MYCRKVMWRAKTAARQAAGTAFINPNTSKEVIATMADGLGTRSNHIQGNEAKLKQILNAND